MAKLQLAPNESLVHQTVNVGRGNLFSAFSGELVLTTQNIIYVDKGIFGNTKGIQRYPLKKIKIYNGIVQALLSENSNNEKLIEIHLDNSVVQFGFSGSDVNHERQMWINGISVLLTGVPSPYGYIDEENALARAIKGTVVESFTSALGLKEKNLTTGKKIAPLPEFLEHMVTEPIPNTTMDSKKNASAVTIKCMGCRAPLSGNAGETMRCKYCDIEQTL